jgi:hypothetical protein
MRLYFYGILVMLSSYLMGVASDSGAESWNVLVFGFLIGCGLAIAGGLYDTGQLSGKNT